MAVSTKITPLHRVETWLYDAIMGHFRRKSLDKASDSGADWARGLGPLTPAHEVALKNLRMAYPNETEAWRRAVADAMWGELGRYVAEFPHLPEISFAPSNGRIELAGREYFDAARESGKGAVFISGHFASFEIMMIAIVQNGVRCLMTYRPLNNPILDRRLLEIRQGYGAAFPAAKSIEGGMGLLRGLARGDSVAIMNDQKYNEGVAAPFFGYDAMTADGPARLALRFNVPLIPLYIRRLNNRVQFYVEAFPPIPIDRTAPDDDAVRQAVIDVNKWLEARVREAPEQWWWVHNRWPKEAWRKAGVI
jgi:KDO2-lipid IV(A) lauroyltransferase